MSALPDARPTAARDHCLGPGRDVELAGPGGRYRRLFPELPSLGCDADALHAIGTSGGACDLAATAAGERQDASVAAGWPFFGQFVAHDITADRSPVEHPDTTVVRNSRAPRANLECLYADGPAGSPYLYTRADPARLLLAESGRDVPRNAEGTAIVGDPRNDTHLFVNQLQVAFLRTHNRLVERLREDGVAEEALFDEARRASMWHYQWLIVNEFLPGLVGSELVEALLRDGPAYYRAEGEPSIPLEFADAAYRYGHSQVRSEYAINARSGPRPMFPDLIGFGPVESDRWVDWSLLFDMPGRPPAQRAKRIDGRLAASLIELPVELTGEVREQAYRSLAVRDLQRGLATGLPSGEAVAALLGADPLSGDEIGLADAGWRGETPLWFYIGREAAVRHDGDRLGEVGGRIVGEVLVGIVASDPESYLSLEPDWQPTLPAARPGRFSLTDLLDPDRD